jgi:hypothetical protein
VTLVLGDDGLVSVGYMATTTLFEKWGASAYPALQYWLGCLVLIGSSYVRVVWLHVAAVLGGFVMLISFLAYCVVQTREPLIPLISLVSFAVAVAFKCFCVVYLVRATHKNANDHKTGHDSMNPHP